jgi:hypothetical protein
MQNKEPLTEQKEQLLALRENYKQVLLGEVKELKTDIIQTKNWLLLAGSVVIVGYVAFKTVSAIFSLFSNTDEKEQKIIYTPQPNYQASNYQVYDPQKAEKDGFLSPIFRALKQEMKLFLLGIARQALREFLENLAKRGGDTLSEKLQEMKGKQEIKKHD